MTNHTRRQSVHTADSFHKPSADRDGPDSRPPPHCHVPEAIGMEGHSSNPVSHPRAEFYLQIRTPCRPRADWWRSLSAVPRSKSAWGARNTNRPEEMSRRCDQVIVRNDQCTFAKFDGILPIAGQNICICVKLISWETAGLGTSPPRVTQIGFSRSVRSRSPIDLLSS